VNTLYKIYFLIPNFKDLGYLGKVMNKILSLTFYFLANIFVRDYYLKKKSPEKYGLNNEVRRNQIIVTLTTIPSRIDNIWITLESIFRQSFKPDRLILWLSNEEFGNVVLPISLLKLKEKGLVINYCENMKSHNKYFHTAVKNPNACIITIDDDIIYPENMISNLIQMHNQYPFAVCSNMTHLVTFENGNLIPYTKWKHTYKKILIPTHKLIQLGVCGVLYPPQSLPNICFDKELIKELSLGSDDVWLNTICLINNIPIVTNKTFNKYFLTIRGSQKISLLSINSFHGRKDKILNLVHNHFGITEEEFRKEVKKVYND
jgi:hypothetical protein